MSGKKYRQGPKNLEADRWGRKPGAPDDREPMKQFGRISRGEGGKQAARATVSEVSSFVIAENPCCKNALKKAKEKVALEEGYESWNQMRDAETGALEALKQWADKPMGLRKMRGLAEGKARPTLDDVTSVYVAMESVGDEWVAHYLRGMLGEMAKANTPAGKIARDCLSVPRA